MENLSATTARLADTSLGEAERQELQRQREELEQQLYRQLPALKPRLVEPDQVARALPADGVLVEFQRFAPYDPTQPEEKRWGEPRYLALMLTREGRITTEDLGRAVDLDGQINRSAGRHPPGEPRQPGAMGHAR